MSLTEKEKANIDSIKIVPPQLVDFNLDGDFGKIKTRNTQAPNREKFQYFRFNYQSLL